ncbi:hypothetical protein D307_gp210 [Bacillus phage Bastille]|uniref:Uncharacterized protein n=1 Tax=Bacillus phage Bastille TaxID=57477 RepID=J9PKG7_9CAUD|nr:hypothetical protein D307_gp210 [Bacillus phage Bastille]AEQ34254.1 hypothetical protein [Bacillus phage Bastille]
MITLCVIGYVLLSLVIYYNYWKDNYDRDRKEWIMEESAKKGIWISFSVIPILLFGVGVVCGILILGFLLVGLVVGWVVDLVMWILTTMP